MYRVDRDTDENDWYDEPDRTTITMVSSVPGSQPVVAGTAPSSQAALSADGQLVAFITKAPNLQLVEASGGGEPADGDLLVADAHFGTLRRVTMLAGGVQPAVGAHSGPQLPYHVRDAEALARRYDAEVVGHAGIRRRLPSRGVRVRVPGPGDLGRGGMRLLACGKPRRSEQPLWVPAHRALCFGDAIVEWDGALRVWAQRTIDDQARRYYRERFAPSLEDAVALAPERILVTHGSPVLSGGAAALERALAGEPWNPPGRD